jgi:hypothetical protein
MAAIITVGSAGTITSTQGAATSAGDTLALAGGAGGATSGNGGAITQTGGAGTNGNSTGGASTNVGGAGQGTGSGGAAGCTGGVSGTGATGNGGAATLTGGAASSTNGNGGNVVLTPGALAGTGVTGMIALRGSVARKRTVTAMTTTATVTVAAIRGGIITANQGAAGAATYTLPTGTVLQNAYPTFTAGDSVEFMIVNISTVDAEDVTVAGDTGTTMKGNVTVEANSAATKVSWARFEAVNTGANTFDVYRCG